MALILHGPGGGVPHCDPVPPPPLVQATLMRKHRVLSDVTKGVLAQGRRGGGSVRSTQSIHIPRFRGPCKDLSRMGPMEFSPMKIHFRTARLDCGFLSLRRRRVRRLPPTHPNPRPFARCCGARQLPPPGKKGSREVAGRRWAKDEAILKTMAGATLREGRPDYCVAQIAVCAVQRCLN